MKKIAILFLLYTSTALAEAPQVHHAKFNGATGKIVRIKESITNWLGEGSGNWIATARRCVGDINPAIPFPLVPFQAGDSAGAAFEVTVDQCKDSTCNETLSLDHYNFTVIKNADGSLGSNPSEKSIKLYGSRSDYGMNCDPSQFPDNAIDTLEIYGKGKENLAR